MVSRIQQLQEKLRITLKDAQLVATPMPLTPAIKLYLLRPDYPQEKLTDDERRVLMDEPPYWAFSWSSGQVLAKWLCDNGGELAGKRVLDFGAGSGVAAIAAALSGAREVVALDTDLLSLEAVQANAELNGVTINTAAALDALEGEFDLILAADVLYDRNNLALLQVFLGFAPLVLVADSRVKNLPAPYRQIGSGRAVTCPDLDEPDEFQQVALFTAPGKT